MAEFLISKMLKCKKKFIFSLALKLLKKTNKKKNLIFFNLCTKRTILNLKIFFSSFFYSKKNIQCFSLKLNIKPIVVVVFVS